LEASWAFRLTEHRSEAVSLIHQEPLVAAVVVVAAVEERFELAEVKEPEEEEAIAVVAFPYSPEHLLVEIDLMEPYSSLAEIAKHHFACRLCAPSEVETDSDYCYSDCYSGEWKSEASSCYFEASYCCSCRAVEGEAGLSSSEASLLPAEVSAVPSSCLPFVDSSEERRYLYEGVCVLFAIVE
jgi:hypothetical protein